MGQRRTTSIPDTDRTSFRPEFRSGGEGKAATGLRPWRWLLLIESISEDKRVCHSHLDFTKIVFQLVSGEQLKEISVQIWALQQPQQNSPYKAVSKLWVQRLRFPNPRDRNPYDLLCMSSCPITSHRKKRWLIWGTGLVFSAEFSGKAIRFLKLRVSCKEGDPTRTFLLNLALAALACTSRAVSWPSQGDPSRVPPTQAQPIQPEAQLWVRHQVRTVKYLKG